MWQRWRRPVAAGMRRRLLLLLLLLGVAVRGWAAADALPGRRVVERALPLETERTGWREAGRAKGERLHEVVFAVRQRNEEELRERLQRMVRLQTGAKMEVEERAGEEDRRRTGGVMTRAEVGALAENREGTRAVQEWVRSHGAVVVHSTRFGEFVRVRAAVSVLEEMFDAEFYTFRHRDADADADTDGDGDRNENNHDNEEHSVVRAKFYSLPETIAKHVRTVFESVQLPSRAPYGLLVRPHAALSRDKTTPLPDDDWAITPELLDSHYRFLDAEMDVDVAAHAGTTATQGATQSVFDAYSHRFASADLAQFLYEHDVPFDGEGSHVRVVGGHGESASQAPCDFFHDPLCADGNAVLSYLLAVTRGKVPTTYWSAAGTPQQSALVRWLEVMADLNTAPLVHVLHYGEDERDVYPSAAAVFDLEAIKLALQGVTLLVPSGNDGAMAPSARGHRPTSAQCSYAPTWPATSEFVLAVGATQGPEQRHWPWHHFTVVEENVCQSGAGGVITSGGGFSTLHERPAFQTTAVRSYFDASKRSPPASGFGSGRGVPDLALAGHNYVVVVGGRQTTVSGTAMSATVMAGYVSLANIQRLAFGLRPLGYITPAVYANAALFTRDVTRGNNCCTSSYACCTEGFNAVEGWDPLSGFGAVDAQRFLEVFTRLA